MKYIQSVGIIKEKPKRFITGLIAIAFVAAASISMFSIGNAATQPTLLDQFTQNELETNWGPDRKFPTGGVESVDFAGRENVAKVGVVATEQDSRDSFYYYEGIKKVSDFGTNVQADLYVPSEWQSADVVNVGLWTSDDPLTAYPLIVYRNNDTAEAGFYTYEYEFDEDGEFIQASYAPSEVPVNYDGWNTLAVSLNVDENKADYYINGVATGSILGFGGSVGDKINTVYLNHYNDGLRDYYAYWHAGLLPVPEQVNGVNVSVDGESLGCYPYVNTRDITVSWNADDAAAYYEYQADADKEAPYDFTTQVSGTERSGQIRDEDGTYNYRVRGVNSTGIAGEWSQWCGVTLDREAPTQPYLLAPADGAIVSGGPKQTWSSDSNDVDYYIYESFYDEGLNMPLYDTIVNGTSRKVGGLQTITIWWRVTAVDRAGNESSPSDAWKLVIDNTKPLITLDNPADDSKLRGDQNFGGTASDDNSGLRNGEIRLSFRPIIDGNVQSPVKTLRVPVSEDGNWNIAFNTTELEDGDYRVVARANDNVGDSFKDSNTAADVIDVVIDNNPDNKEACKKDGWSVFANPSFRNQGDCVSWTVSEKQQKDNPDANHGSKKQDQFSLKYSKYLFGDENSNSRLQVR